MLQCTLIGNLGGNAEVKTSEGREFVAFRVAHNDSFTDAAGVRHDRSQWVDCVMNCTNGRPAVLPYLNAGTQVCVLGSITTRIYSSEKDRCMKAGLTLHVRQVELLGGSSDPVPKRLYSETGLQVDIQKFYFAQAPAGVLRDIKGREFTVDDAGWVKPKINEPNVQPQG